MSDVQEPVGPAVRPEDHLDQTNAGKWDGWYAGLKGDGKEGVKTKYGAATTYQISGAFLSDCYEVEDWGCGRGVFKTFCGAPYIGVDGSQTPYATKIAELGVYRSSADGILLRHVLEHNYNWPPILKAAVASFRSKLCVVLFTPFSDTTRELGHNRKYGVDVPDLALSRAEVEAHFEGLQWKLFENIKTASQYGVEQVYLVWRPKPRGFWARLKALFA